MINEAHSMQSNQSNVQNPSHGIPEGYVRITSSDGQEYVVPQFMVPATHQALDAYSKKLDLDAANAAGGVSKAYHLFVRVERAGGAGICHGPGAGPDIREA
jgi:hypothetical protein